MNNEEKILSLLEQLIEKQDQMVARQDKTDESIAQMRKEQVQMHQEINQVQMHQEINERLDLIESDLKYIAQDVSLVEKRIRQHELEFHNVG